jgi:opacity protein-like surface antigen
MRILTTISTIALVAGSGAAHAQMANETTGFYIGGGYTYLDVNTDTEFDSVDDIGNDVNAIMARVGYQFTPMFSVEGEGTFGIDEGEFDFEGDSDDFDFDSGDDSGSDLGDTILASGSGDLELNYLFAGFVRAQYPVSDRFDVHGRVGYAFIEAEANASLDGEGDPDDSFKLAEGDDNGLAFGAGATFDVTERFQLRADYTRYEFDDVDANGVSVTAGFKF